MRMISPKTCNGFGLPSAASANFSTARSRPALVISPKSYNRKTSFCVLCPATRQAKGYAFEVNVSEKGETASVILSDHLRNVDWKARGAERIKRVSDKVLAAVIARIEALLIEPDT